MICKVSFKKNVRLCCYRIRTRNALPSDDYLHHKIEVEHISDVEFEKQDPSVDVRGINYTHCTQVYPDTSNASLKIN